MSNFVQFWSVVVSILVHMVPKFGSIWFWYSSCFSCFSLDLFYACDFGLALTRFRTMVDCRESLAEGVATDEYVLYLISVLGQKKITLD
jgi:hypothetical protein